MKKSRLLCVVFSFLIVVLLTAYSSADDTYLWLSVPAQNYPGEMVQAQLSVGSIHRVQFTLSWIQDPAEYIAESRKEQFFDVATWRPDRPLEQRERWQNIKHGFFQSVRILASHLLPERTRKYLQDLFGISGPLSPRLIEVSAEDYQRGTRELKTWVEEIRYPSDSRYVFTTYSIPDLKEGMYLLTARGGGREARVLFSVSRLAFSMKQEGIGKALFFVQDATTGVPQREVPIQVIEQDEVTAKGWTDDRGIWSADLEVLSQAAIIAGEEGHYAFISFWPYSYPGVEEKVEAFLTTERPLYRPGQRVFFRGVLRSVISGGYLTPPAGETVTVLLTDYSDNEYGHLELQSNQFGSVSGWFDLPQALREGGYLLKMEWRDRSFYRFVSIENFEKPAFEIELKTDREVYANREEMIFHLKAVYYSGEPMAPARYRYRVIRYPLHGAARGMRGEMILEEDGDLDQEGQREIRIVPEVEENVYRYEVTAQVFDPAYRVVEKTTSVRVLPGDYALILRPDRFFGESGKPYRWTVSAVDAQDRLVSVDKVFSSVKKLTWNEQNQEYDEQLLQFDSFSLSEGKDTVEITVEHGGYYEFEVMSQDDSGNRIRFARRFYITGAGLYIPAWTVEINLDQAEYRVGDEVRALIIPPEDAGPFHFLLTVEGRSVHSYQVQMAEGPQEVVFPVEAAHVLGCFIGVTAFSDGQFYQETIEVPILPERELEVEITVDQEVYLPGEAGSIHIRVVGPDGQPRQSEVSLAVVDQAIFDMSWFWWENIYDYFYQYFYNQVFTYSSQYTSFYGYGVQTPDARAQMKMGNGVEGDPLLRQYFPDTLVWEPSLVTDHNGEITIPFQNADNLTRWRVEVRAIDQEYFGEQVVHFRTASPFALRVSPPPFLFSGDWLVSESTLWNAFGAQSVKLNLLTSPELAGWLDDESLTIDREENLVFPLTLEALEKGDSWFRLYARGELASDALELKIPVKEAGIRIHQERSVLLQGEPGVLVFEMDPEAFTEEPEVRITLFTDQNERLLREGELMYHYPYRCTEQIASQIISLLSLPASPRKDWMEEIPSLVREGLYELYSMQNYDGGWAWWSYGESQMFHTAHILLAFSLAREYGYPVSEPALDRARNFLEWFPSDENLEPFDRLLAHYALFRLFGEVPEYPEGLESAEAQLDDKALALLVLLTRIDSSNRLAGLLLERGTSYGDTLFFGQRNPERPWEDDRVLSTAWAAAALKESGFSREAHQALLWLWRSLEGDRYLNTVDQACFLFVNQLFTDTAVSAGRASYQVTINQKPVPGGVGVMDEDRSYQLFIPTELIQPGINRVEVSGEGLFMATLDLKGFRQEPPDTGLIEVERRYWKLRPARQEDRSLAFAREPVDHLLPGDEVLCELVINSPHAFENLVIEDGMPAGFELVRSWYSPPLTGETHLEYYTFFQNITLYDHQPVIFVSQLKSGKNVIRYLLRVRDTGIFTVPPARVFLMYHPEVYGYSEGTVVEIGR